MQLRNTADRYGAIPQTLHWLTVALVLLAWLLGEFGDAFPKGPARAGALWALRCASASWISRARGWTLSCSLQTGTTTETSRPASATPSRALVKMSAR